MINIKVIHNGTTTQIIKTDDGTETVEEISK